MPPRSLLYVFIVRTWIAFRVFIIRGQMPSRDASTRPQRYVRVTRVVSSRETPAGGDRTRRLNTARHPQYQSFECM